MTATVADIARFTNDGVVLTLSSQAVRDRYPDAKSVEIANFFDSQADAQKVMDERFLILTMDPRLHEMVELGDRLGLGTEIQLAPTLPAFTIIDEERGVNGRGVICAYSFTFESDHYAIEVVGMPLGAMPRAKVTYDSTVVTQDSTRYTHDQTK